MILLRFVIPLFYATAYMFGGRDKSPLFRPRIWRRFLAPVILGFGLSCLSNNVTYVISLPLYIGAMYLTKYGGDTPWEKIRGRALSGLVVGVASLPIALFAKSYVLGCLQIALAVLAHLLLGIKNPFPEKYKAEIEEFTISFLTVVLVPFML